MRFVFMFVVAVLFFRCEESCPVCPSPEEGNSITVTMEGLWRFNDWQWRPESQDYSDPTTNYIGARDDLMYPVYFFEGDYRSNGSVIYNRLETGDSIKFLYNSTGSYRVGEFTDVGDSHIVFEGVFEFFGWPVTGIFDAIKLPSFYIHNEDKSVDYDPTIMDGLWELRKYRTRSDGSADNSVTYFGVYNGVVYEGHYSNDKSTEIIGGVEYGQLIDGEQFEITLDDFQGIYTGVFKWTYQNQVIAEGTYWTNDLQYATGTFYTRRIPSYY